MSLQKFTLDPRQNTQVDVPRFPFLVPVRRNFYRLAGLGVVFVHGRG